MDQDPVIHTQLLCTSPLCGQPMGALRVYKSAGDPERRHLRGAICQTVSVKVFMRYSERKGVLVLLLVHNMPQDCVSYSSLQV
jgi:hypothetical protein